MTPLRFLSPGENFMALERAHSHPDDASVIVIPVPFEQTSSFGLGSSGGPEAIITASHEVELFDAALGFEPFQAVGGIATLAAMDLDGLDGERVSQRLCAEVSEWLERGKFVVTLGGEHTSIVGAVRAHCEACNDLTVLQFDAHSDLRPDYLGTRWNHACAVARILDFHDSVVQVGIRSQDKAEREVASAKGLPVFYAHAIHHDAEQGHDWVQPILDATRQNVYITFDCDVLDPSVIPATGTPEPGGLTWLQVDKLLKRLCAARNVVGLDVNELAPIEGINYPQFTIAKLIYRFIGYRVAREGLAR